MPSPRAGLECATPRAFRVLTLGEVVEDFGGVAFGFDGGPDGFDFAVFADEK